MKERPVAVDNSLLFRQEALDAKRTAQHGEIVLLPGASSWAIALLALAVVVALALLITHGSYTRRSTVGGQLIPSEGLIRVTAGQAGIVVERKAADRQVVQRGDLLFVVSSDRMGPGAVDYQQGIARQIEARRSSLESDLWRIGEAETQEAQQLLRRIASLRGEMAQIAQQGQLLASRVLGATDAQARYQELYRQGYASRDELLARETEVTELRSRVEGQRRDALALERDSGTTRRELEAQRGRYANQRAEIERAILLAQQEFTESEARRRVAVTAPADGQLTLVQAEVGQSIDPTRPLALLVPASNKLIARLYAPSRAAGFVRPGETVLLRYDPFPYQKYGQHAGKVVSVSAAAVGPSELQGLIARPELNGEAMFAITVSLPDQTLQGDGRTLALQAGMRVDADLLQEKRPLYEWMLEPLYAARARVKTN